MGNNSSDTCVFIIWQINDLILKHASKACSKAGVSAASVFLTNLFIFLDFLGIRESDLLFLKILYNHLGKS